MTRSPSPSPSRSWFQPLDRVAITVIFVLAVLIGLLLWHGGHSAPRVREFTWQDKQIGADDTAFILNFSRPMDHASVESNLWINPPLAGKASWAGRRMAYTLDMPAPYGTLFQIELQRSRDRFTKADSPRATLQPFTGRFRSRDRAFAYIGVAGEEDGRLILYNLTQQKKEVLTPKDLVVNEFKPYPLGDRILFAATPRTAQLRGILEQQLYTVTTGIHIQPPVQIDDPDSGNSPALPSSDPAGTIKLLLDNQSYQTLKFDLSADGKIIVVQRVNRKDPADFGPWILRQGEPPQPLKGEPGGDFLIAPDSNSLAISQGQGLAILPLVPDAKPLDFLPRFGMILSFSRDGTEAAVIKFNSDRAHSLFLVNSQGKETELLKTPGSILNAQFDPMKQTLYCLLTELPTEQHPYLAAIDLKTKKLTPLLLLPNQREVQISLSPDGLAFLFDQTEHSENSNPTTDEPGQNQQGKAISTSRLWLFPVDPANPTAKSQPESLPMAGLRPRWMP